MYDLKHEEETSGRDMEKRDEGSKYIKSKGKIRANFFASWRDESGKGGKENERSETMVERGEIKGDDRSKLFCGLEG